jgi:hypothetical protein
MTVTQKGERLLAALRAHDAYVEAIEAIPDGWELLDEHFDGDEQHQEDQLMAAYGLPDGPLPGADPEPTRAIPRSLRRAHWRCG